MAPPPPNSGNVTSGVCPAPRPAGRLRLGLWSGGGRAAPGGYCAAPPLQAFTHQVSGSRTAQGTRGAPFQASPRAQLLPMGSTALRFLQPVRHSMAAGLSGPPRHVRPPRLVLGIETSCDDTGAAVLDEAGTVLGEALQSQKEVHLKAGGIIPHVAQQLHRESIQQVVKEALSASGVSVNELAAIATTVKPGLALSLEVGLQYSLQLVDRYQKPFIPIHHMEAHALTIRLTEQVEFPFLVLLLSGGHCILAVARGVSDFLLLGQSIDIAPGDMLDKVARRLSLVKHPECHSMAGGKAIEHLAQTGDWQQYTFRLPMQQYRNCDFSFSGLQSLVNKAILQKEKEEGIQEGEILSCVKDIAAAAQHVVAAHIIQRTHRAMLFCMKNSILLPNTATLVVSGGVASNQYIRKGLQTLANANGFAFLSPPPRLCTDNGVMIAWNGIERLRAGCGILYSTDGIRYEPKAPLGIDISKRVEEDSIKVPRLRKIQWSAC